MIISSDETLYAKHLGLCLRLQREYQPLVNTTLNEKFDILPGQEIPAGQYPKLNYLVIGIGGAEVVTGNDYKFSRHKPTDAALFQHIPFVIRTADNDLLPGDQAKYRLRRTENIGGTEYVCYYMKIIEDFIMRDEVYQINAGVDFNSLTIFDTNTENILEPTPRNISDPVDTINNNYVAVTVKLDFILSVEELNEIENAMTIKYGTVSKLTEIGIVSGYDFDNSGVTEIVGAVINFFVTIDLTTGIYLAQNSPVARSIEIGGMEPLVS